MTTSTAEAAPAKRKGAIHDLGYKRYLGSRRPQSTRWRVITRHQMAHGWKTWWRYKLWLGIAVITTVFYGGVMVMSRSDTLEAMPGQQLLLKFVDQLVFTSIGIYGMIAFLTTLTLGASVVATDVKSGAFTFYFARPVRPIDYVLGKLVGLTVLMSFVTLVPLLLISFVRVGLSENTDELLRTLAYVPKSLLVGSLAALAYASVSLGFSALFSNPRYAVAAWAAVYFVGGFIVIGIGAASKTPEIAAIDIKAALESLSYQLFGYWPIGSERVIAPTAVASTSLGLWIAAGIGATFLRVRASGFTGIGAS